MDQRPDLRLANIASRQHGVVTFVQAIECGLTRRQVASRVETGRLFRVHRGVYAVGHDNLTERGSWMAAVLASGERALLTGRCAAALWGVSRFRPRGILVLVPFRHRPVIGVELRHTRVSVADERAVRSDIPVTSVERTLVELAAGDLFAHQLAHVIHECAYHGLLDVPRLRAVAARHVNRTGHRELTGAIELHEAGSVGTRSGLEDAFLNLVVRSRLPMPLVNTHVPVTGGSVEVDFHWPDQCLCVEVDGPGHDRPGARAQDEMRDAALRSAGHHVVRVRAGQLEHGIALVRAHLAERAAR